MNAKKINNKHRIHKFFIPLKSQTSAEVLLVNYLYTKQFVLIRVIRVFTVIFSRRGAKAQRKRKENKQQTSYSQILYPAEIADIRRSFALVVSYTQNNSC